MSFSETPRKDYLMLTRDFVVALQTHIRQFEDHPSIFERDFLEEAYKVQGAMIQQHFSALSILYDREFTANSTDPIDAVKESSIIMP